MDFPSFETCGPSSSFSCASLKPCNFDTWQTDSGFEEAETGLTGFPAFSLRQKV